MHNKSPDTFYGWRGSDTTSRAADRAAYFAAGAIYNTLCNSASLYLDSFLQVREGEGRVCGMGGRRVGLWVGVGCMVGGGLAAPCRCTAACSVHCHL